MAKRKRPFASASTIKQDKTAKSDSTTTKRVTRSMRIDAPRQAVFATAELLEQIILSLPFKRIFVLQRVCRQFRDIVATSKTIRQKLFLEPSCAARTFWVARSLAPPSIPQDWLPAYNLQLDVCNAAESVMPLHWKVTPSKLNPLLEVMPYFGSVAKRFWKQGHETVWFDLTAALRGPSTWKDMHLTHPPCLSAMIDLSWHFKESRSIQGSVPSIKVSDPQGVKVGALVDAALLLQPDPRDAWYRIKGEEVHGLKNTFLNDVLIALGETDRNPAVMSHSMVQLHDVIIPTEEEWATVR